jgi:Ni2+-binding GTPase involved in maturation of urease and hydrogenase
MEEIRLIDVKEEILAENRDLADQTRQRLLSKGAFLLNLMGSPGSGKTSLIVETIALLHDRYRIAVVETDIDSLVDSERVAKEGLPGRPDSDRRFLPRRCGHGGSSTGRVAVGRASSDHPGERGEPGLPS